MFEQRRILFRFLQFFSRKNCRRTIRWKCKWWISYAK